MDRQAVNHMIMTTGWSVIVALAITAPASAHHSSIGYDLSKTNTVKLPDGRTFKDAEFEGARNGANEAKEAE